MRFLFDENLSRHLCRLLSDIAPDSRHVDDLGLRGASDTQVWDAAAAGGFVLVSKDDDFQQRALVHGPPPLVVRLAIGNCPTGRVATVLRTQAETIRRMAHDGAPSVLVLVVP
jgi:predicted nuclease of predicted toxin-antitoxin system